MGGPPMTSSIVVEGQAASPVADPVRGDAERARKKSVAQRARDLEGHDHENHPTEPEQDLSELVPQHLPHLAHGVPQLGRQRHHRAQAEYAHQGHEDGRALRERGKRPVRGDESVAGLQLVDPQPPLGAERRGVRRRGAAEALVQRLVEIFRGPHRTVEELAGKAPSAGQVLHVPARLLGRARDEEGQIGDGAGPHRVLVAAAPLAPPHVGHERAELVQGSRRGRAAVASQYVRALVEIDLDGLVTDEDQAQAPGGQGPGHGEQHERGRVGAAHGHGPPQERGRREAAQAHEKPPALPPRPFHVGEEALHPVSACRRRGRLSSPSPSGRKDDQQRERGGFPHVPSAGRTADYTNGSWRWATTRAASGAGFIPA